MMGGNALSFETRRVNSDEYFDLVDEIKEKLTDVLIPLMDEHLEIPNPFKTLMISSSVHSFIADVKAYRNKPDFGDIDILLLSSIFVAHKPHDVIKSAFNPRQIEKNGNVYSFDYKNVQVDFILASSVDEFTMSEFYFAWNDLGNLMGRIAHKLGLKLGHDGLKFIINDGDQKIGTIMLSTTPRDILDYLKFDVTRYFDGFDDLKDIFEFVIDNPLYSYDIFDLDNRNHTARMRDRKRKSYTEFLKYGLENRKPNEFDWKVFPKEFWISSFLYHFDKIEEYKEILRRHSIDKQIKQKYNGVIVGSITNLQGKELGVFMSSFSNVFSKDDLYKMSESAIVEEVINHFRTFE